MNYFYKYFKENAWAIALGVCLAKAGWTTGMWQFWVSVVIIVWLNYWSKLPD